MKFSLKKYLTLEKLAGLIGLILVSSNVSFMSRVSSIYYGVLLVALFYLLLKAKVAIHTPFMYWLYAACIISICFNNIAPVFRPWPRFGTFLMLTLLVSPTIGGLKWTRFRSTIFSVILYLLVLVVIGSSIVYFTGGGYDRGYFEGITNHSMLLGPFAALSCLLCIYQLIAQKQSKKRKFIYMILIFLSLLCLLQAGSRTALIGALVSAVVLIVMYYGKKKRKSVLVIAIALTALALTHPLWSQYMDKINEKNGDTRALNTDSREVLWKQSITEWKSSPFWGIGFSTVDITSEIGQSVTDADGGVETGSSWLCTLSMTGLAGFIPLVIVFLASLRKLRKLWRLQPLISSFMIAVIIFWIIHMVAEGYIFAGGSSLAFLAWLSLGVSYGIANNKQEAELLEKRLVF